MLCVARQARTAYRFGPIQNRRTVAGEELRSTYTTAQVAWLDCQANTNPFNQAAIVAQDSAYDNVSLQWQASTPASTNPLWTSANNITCLQFDGVDDIFNANTFVPTTGPAITIVALYQNFSATNDRIICEGGTDYNFQTTAYLLSGGQTGATSSLKGDVGYSTRTWTSAQNNWLVTATVQNKAAGLGSEVLVYQNGTQVTVFTVSTNSDNTNNFNNQLPRVGRRAGGTFPMNGRVAAVCIFNRVLTLAEIQNVTRLLRWRSGLS